MEVTSTQHAFSQITEVSDAEVLRLYDFVYNNLADVKKTLLQTRSQDDTPEKGKARVHLLTTLTTQLGSSARKGMVNGQEQVPVQISSSVNIGDYNEFMERSKGRNIEAFNSAGIFYLAGMSKVITYMNLLIVATSTCAMFCSSTVRLCFYGSWVIHLLSLPRTSPYSLFNFRSWNRFGMLHMKSSSMLQLRLLQTKSRLNGLIFFEDYLGLKLRIVLCCIITTSIRHIGGTCEQSFEVLSMSGTIWKVVANSFEE